MKNATLKESEQEAAKILETLSDSVKGCIFSQLHREYLLEDVKHRAEDQYGVILTGSQAEQIAQGYIDDGYDSVDWDGVDEHIEGVLGIGDGDADE